jgi:hypothetical protein
MALANSDRFGRSLEHSKVLYEGDTPILRLAWNKQDPSYIGMSHCLAIAVWQEKNEEDSNAALLS